MEQKQNILESQQTVSERFQRKKDSRTYICLACVVYLCAWSILPQLQLDMIWRVVALACAALWGGLVVSDSRGKAAVFRNGVGLCALFLLLVVVVTYIETFRVSRIIAQISFFMLFIGFLMVNYYWGRVEDIAILPTIVLLLFVIPNVITIKELFVNPHVMRLIVRNDEETYQYIRKGVGGYGLLYPQVCLFPAALAWILQARKEQKVKFVIGCLWLASYLGLILKAGYSIAIISTAVSIYVLFFHKGTSIVGLIFCIVFIIMSSSLLLVYSETFRNFLLEIFEGTKVTQKINDVLLSIQNGEADGSVGDRTTKYMISLSTILEYPVIGGLWMTGVGSHSAIMDVFAKYGLFGGWMFTKMFFSVYLMYKKKSKDRFMVHVLNASMAALLMVGILNTTPYQCMLPFTVVLLSIIGEVEKWRREPDEDIMDRQHHPL